MEKVNGKTPQMGLLELPIDHADMNEAKRGASKIVLADEEDEDEEEASALSGPKVRVGLNSEIWESSANKEVSHEQEVHRSVDGDGTSNAA